MNIRGMNQFDMAYYHCMMALNKNYRRGMFDIMSKDSNSKIMDTMLEYEEELGKLWNKDYPTFRGVLVSYYKFMRGVLRKDSK